MDNTQPQNTPKQKDYLLPASIIIAALLVAGAWIYTAGLKNIEPKKSGQVGITLEKTAPNMENVIPVSDNDHIRGDKNALVKIVEFSDMECPYCKTFHETMIDIMKEYGAKGEVAWIYRHWPLEQLHPLAQKAAEASECAAKIGGNDIFWKYLDQYMTLSSSEDNLISNKFTEIAENVGINKSQFENCLNSREFKEKIEAQIENAANSNPECPRCGTPFSIVIAKNGKKYSIPGALPYKEVKTIIEEALK